MRVELKRVKWLNGYMGPSRWVAASGAEEFGLIALRNAGEQHQRIEDGQFDTMGREFAHGCYGKLVYRVDSRLFIIGENSNYPVRHPLYELTGLDAVRESGNRALVVEAA